MTITAGAASAKISELRSKLAIYNAWVELINANYMPCDGGPAEVHITREDGGTATEAHFTAVLEDIEHKCAELREELVEWENLVFEPRGAQVRPLHPAANDQTKKLADRKQPRRAQPAPK